MEEALARYGLAAVFFGALLEGDVSVMLAGVLAHLGFFDLKGAIIVGACGGVVADVVCYAIGRTRAASIRNTAVYQRVGAFVERLVRRIGPWEVALARFIYGARIASMLCWGMWELPVARFLALDLVGCAVWSTVLTSLGFVTSRSAVILIGRFKRAERWLLVSLLLAAGVVFGVRRLARRLQR